MENYNNEEENITKEYDSKLMRRLLKFAKPYKWYIILVIFIMLIVTAMDLARPYLIKNAIDNNLMGYNKEYTIVAKPLENSIPLGDKYVVQGYHRVGEPCSMVYHNNSYYIIHAKVQENTEFSIKVDRFTQGGASYKADIIKPADLKILRKTDAQEVIKTAVYIVIIAILIFILNYIQTYILQYTGQKIVFSIREAVFKQVEGLSLSFFDKNPVGRLVTRVTNDVETLNEMYTAVLVNLFKDLFMLVGIIIAMFILDVKLALITVGSLPFVIFTAYLFKKYDREAYRKVRARLARINSSISENISGMKTVQVFGKEEKKYKEFAEVNKSYKEATMGQIKVFAIFRPTMDLFSSLTLAVLLWFGGIRAIDGNIKLGVLFVFISYLMQFFQPIFDLTEKYDILQSSMASSERIFMLMDNQEKINNIKNPVEVDRLKGNIEFKNVWFAYKDEDWVLKDVSFNIQIGEKIAFVGATGAGKTSIINLITRLYDIQKGEILVDGQNIKHMRKEKLRENIATVLQDVFLFAGDIKGNVRLNNKNISDEDIIKACRYVNADKFIEKLPEKYSAPVNERGSTFSQGQRQLIAFARAIAFDPPILVLDEATSNIDTETESLIQDALNKLTINRTTIIVAHRLSTIKNADKIIVLHKGRIREIGNHEELVEKQGLYSNLYKLQYMEGK
ncbi:ABC transporter ATP-binding protein/permease [Clostridium estertheticum]|uniref:ABC transporter ATP-binding protein n=1 Tax=Clostridium estertheticum TaxID=238834 RepID=UPI0013E902CF|nr:ABC transporter ATP-binding protein [Clostridium estertheticum]MBZ9688922.1 ABC transporter ATP-binding protein/permease [Clostridium estertheticum]